MEQRVTGRNEARRGVLSPRVAILFRSAALRAFRSIYSPCLRVSVVIFLLAAGAWGQGAGQGRKLPADAERISDNLYRIGKVIVDLKARSVSCEGKVNMQRGLVEYFAVASHGKLHESVL